MSYLIKTVAVTTTPAVVVTANADEDRMLHLSPDTNTVVVGFDNTDGLPLREAVPHPTFGGSIGPLTEFVLPAGQSLYAWTSGLPTTANLGIIATKIVR